MELSRRRWMQLWAGLGLGLGAGCQPRSDVAHIGGEILGAGDRRGHLLRDGGQALRSRAPAQRSRSPVVIVGGGVAGLSAAWRLHRAGFDDFVLLELEDQAGGTARSGQNAVSPYPWGAHYLPVPSSGLPALSELLRELGVLTGFDAAGRAICGEEHLCRSPQERIFYKGRWYEGLYLRAGASAEDLRQLDRFHEEISRWVAARGATGQRAFSLPRRHSDPTAAGAGALDQVTMATHLDRLGLTSSRLRWYVNYACRDDFGMASGAASAWAGFHYYAARLLHPDDTPPEVLTWPAGNGWLVGRLLDRVGARVRTGCLAVDVRRLPEGGADKLEVLYLDTSRTGGQPDAAAPLCSISAQHVVFALPAFLRPHLIADLRSGSAPGDYLRHFSYAPWLVANLTVRRAHASPVGAGHGGVAQGSGHPPCWDNVLVESPALGYVVATHQHEAAPPAPGSPPRTVWTYYLPLCDGDPRAERSRLLSTPWSSWRDFILADLSRAEPGLASQVERIDIFRWGHGMVRPALGLITSGALAAAAAPLGNIHFANTDLAGMALFEEAHHAGITAAEAVLTAANHPFERWS